jgi:FERM/RhoGEF/pleckstrin domain protein 2
LFQAKAAGKMLFELVCKQLNLLETDYFGLEYTDSQAVTVSFGYWL